MATDGVTITFELRLKPEAVEMFVQSIPAAIHGTASFAGFRSIRIVRHKDDRTRVLFVECWDSEEAYGKYLAWRAGEGAIAGLESVVVSAETNVWPDLVVEA